MQYPTIDNFLNCTTSQAWVEAALLSQDILLIDHANCEKKAAATAISLLNRYPHIPEIQYKMSRLAREELRHFEQVVKFMQKRQVIYNHLSASRYAKGLHGVIRPSEPGRLIDLLIIGAYIEARSCERFSKLAPHLDDELGKFYTGLLSSESRHFTDYLKLAHQLSCEPIEDRIKVIGEKEAELINTPDEQFRFHSGVPL